FLDALPAGLVQEVHMAGGVTVHDEMLGKRILADSHSHPVPDETLALLDHMLTRHTPAAVILERDDRLEAVDEILADIARIRAHVVAARPGESHGEAPARSDGGTARLSHGRGRGLGRPWRAACRWKPAGDQSRPAPPRGAFLAREANGEDPHGLSQDVRDPGGP